jgi:hypothetical protein
MQPVLTELNLDMYIEGGCGSSRNEATYRPRLDARFGHRIATVRNKCAL